MLYLPVSYLGSDVLSPQLPDSVPSYLSTIVFVRAGFRTILF